MIGFDVLIYFQLFINIYPARAEEAEIHHLVLIIITLYLIIIGPKSSKKKDNSYIL